MKKTMALIITVVMLFATFPVAALTDTQKTASKTAVKTTAEPTKTPDKTINRKDAEILRAISYGFVPDKLQGNWDKTITFSQFCTMLKNMLSRYDKKLVLA